MDDILKSSDVGEVMKKAERRGACKVICKFLMVVTCIVMIAKVTIYIYNRLSLKKDVADSDNEGATDSVDKDGGDKKSEAE